MGLDFGLIEGLQFVHNSPILKVLASAIRFTNHIMVNIISANIEIITEYVTNKVGQLTSMMNGGITGLPL
jgi:aspartate ammonia-lyase